MSRSLKSHLVVGAAAVTAAALVASPTTTSASQSIQPAERAVTARVDLAAAVKPIILEPLRPEQVAMARDAISRIDPTAVLPAAAPAVAPLNAASDGLNSAYQWLQYWVNYGIELADYVLQFLPFGYFIADQINIFYDFLITPIADSIVYGLIDPILNDPLNLSTWVDGLIHVGQTSVTAAINTGIVEFNYFFGWLIPPLPPRPIPPLPLAEVETLVDAVQTLDIGEGDVLTSVPVEEKTGTELDAVTESPAEAPQAEVPEAEVPEAEVPEAEVPEAEIPADELTVETPEEEGIEVDDETIDLTPPAELTPIKSTLGTVSAQGQVRGDATTTPGTDTKPADPAADKDKSAPSTAPGAGVDKTDATSKTAKTDSTSDNGKPEKKDAAAD
jgi:hypothetical protein